MHRMTDIPPVSPQANEYFANKPFYVVPEHKATVTGTDSAYRPYPSVKPKISSWTGKPAERLA